AFSPDSKTLAASKTDRTIPLWDVATGTELRRFSVPLGPGESAGPNRNNPIWGLEFSPDGKVLACCACQSCPLEPDISPSHRTVRCWPVAPMAAASASGTPPRFTCCVNFRPEEMPGAVWRLRLILGPWRPAWALRSAFGRFRAVERFSPTMDIPPS